MTARRFSAFGLGILLSSWTALAQPLPQPQGRINDFAGVINSATRDQLQSVIDQLEKETTAEIAVVTVKDAGERTPKQLATALFNDWGVGKKDKNNGFMLLLALKERRIETEVGYGLETVLTDPITEDVLQEVAVPLLKQGNWGGGLAAATRRFAELIRGGQAAGEVGALVPEQEGQAVQPKPKGGKPQASRLISPPQPQTFRGRPWYKSFPWIVIPAVGVFVFLASRRIPGLGCFGFGLAVLCGPSILSMLAGPYESGVLWLWAGGIASVAGGIGWWYIRKHTCPQCKKYLSFESETLVPATYTSSGSGKWVYDCPHCGYHNEETYTIAQLTRSSSGSRRSSSGGSRRSGGSRSFGGGRSGGRGGGSSF